MIHLRALPKPISMKTVKSELHFLKCVKNGKLFVLNEKDKSYVAFEDIVTKLPTPDIKHKRGTDYYKFSCEI